MIKGTVIGPVVTPPESKATDKNDLGIKTDKINTIAYSPINILDNDQPNKILKMAKAKKKPTPIATVAIKTLLGIDVT